MIIELTETRAKTALHPQHPELWVRAVTEEPLGPKDFPKVLAKTSPADQQDMERYMLTEQCGFFVDLWEHSDEAGREDLGFEQWWTFPMRAGLY